MNHANKVKAEQQATAYQVMRLLDWNEQQYTNFQFEQAFEYLGFWIGEDVFGYKELPLTASYWAWWRNHWHRRDVEFIAQAQPMSINERRKLYNHINDPETIDYTPHSAVMADAYAKMSYSVTHAEVTV